MEDDGRISECSSVQRGGGRNGGAATSLGGIEDSMRDETVVDHSNMRPELRCNACWEVLLPSPHTPQTCYRTTCSHIFCVRTLNRFSSMDGISEATLRKNALTNTLGEGECLVLAAIVVS